MVRVHRSGKKYESSYSPYKPSIRSSPSSKAQAISSLPHDAPSQSQTNNVTGNNTEFPDVFDVSLNAEQAKLWLDFKKFDEKTPTIYIMSLGPLFQQTASSIEVNHPLVPFIVAFAVDSYNKAFTMLVKAKKKRNYLKLNEVITGRYHKYSSHYLFHMKIKATEGNHSGVYLAKVEVRTLDGTISLLRFYRTDQSPEDKGGEAIPLPPTTGVRAYKVPRWSDPWVCYRATGLRSRRTWKGYDFYLPYGCDGLLI